MKSVPQIFSGSTRRLMLLIVCSLLLLGISQVLWLNKVWKEQRESLEQEANYLFQNTVIRLQDSLVVRALQRTGQTRDKLPYGRINRISFQPSDSCRDSIPRVARIYSKTEVQQEWNNEGQMRVVIAMSDSHQIPPPQGLGRFLLRVNHDSTDKPKTDFVFEFQRDTLRPEMLYVAFAEALDSAGLPISFGLMTQAEPPPRKRPQELTTEFFPAGVLNPRFYAAKLHDYEPYLWRKALPSAFFSILLFGLTAFAFFLIFQNLRRQHRLAAQKNEFISNVTHELKTPLTTVGVALEALQDFQVWQRPEKAQEYLNISKLELERLNLLVDKVLRLSMFEQEALNLRPETLDFVALVRQVIDVMRLQARNLGVQLACVIPDDMVCWVNGDRLHLTGVIYNLLDNAFKYRRENALVQVDMETAFSGGKTFARLRVRDNGIGIPTEYQSQVFDKFFRVPAGNTHNVKGHGLGLAYVAEVLRRHGGDIRVESRLGEGSVFTVEIPLVTPPPAA